MVQIIKKISLEVSKPNLIQAIVAKQYDNNSRFLQVTLIHEGKKIEIAPTSTVIINAKRIDGEEKPFAGEANNDGTATVPLTYWMLELEGEVWCDVSVVDTDGRKLTSTKFDLLVEKASCSNDDITEDENYDVLVKLIEDVGKVTPDLKYDPTSEKAQSGVAVAEALSGVNGIKYITEYVGIQELENGIYFVDGAGDGNVYAEPLSEISNYAGLGNVFDGCILISDYACNNEVKLATIIATDDYDYIPKIFTIAYDKNGKLVDKIGFEFVSKSYVNEQIASLQAQTQVPKNVEKHYRTEFDIASLNYKSITHSNANGTSVLNPFSFKFFKSLIGGSKTQVFIEFGFIPTITDTVSGEKYAIFSNSPSDANFITDINYIITMDGQSVSVSPEMILSTFKEALPNDSLVKHTVYCDEGVQNAVAYNKYKSEIYVETSDSTTMDALWSEIEPLLQQITHISMDFKEVDIETKEGELIYE